MAFTLLVYVTQNLSFKAGFALAVRVRMCASKLVERITYLGLITLDTGSGFGNFLRGTDLFEWKLCEAATRRT